MQGFRVPYFVFLVHRRKDLWGPHSQLEDNKRAYTVRSAWTICENHSASKGSTESPLVSSPCRQLLLL